MDENTDNNHANYSCEECKEVNCICGSQEKESKTEKKRIKGSHRNGNPPKIKWI